jgi:hypothetical protein
MVSVIGSDVSVVEMAVPVSVEPASSPASLEVPAGVPGAHAASRRAALAKIAEAAKLLFLRFSMLIFLL